MAATARTLLEIEPRAERRFRALPQVLTRQRVIRALIVINLLLGAHYLFWRYTDSINWRSWPLAFALLAAETYSFVGAMLFGLGMWRWRRRSTHPRPRGDETVDVFITCYNEPVAIVRETVRAALAIRHPANVYLCDDGASPAMRAMAAAEGCGYLTRSEEWDGKERHAKAGNLTNALNQTSGEFVLILDADQMPLPEILDETLGYFADPKVAFVQTPQWFRNIAAGDPLGNQAPLFYGPIQEAKDGWNASFFCGSNAVLRRDALLHAGLVNYSRDLERQIGRMLDGATRFLNPAARQLRERGERRYVAAVEMVRTAVSQARAELQAGEPLAEVTYRFQRRAQDAARVVIAAERAEAAHAAPDANDRQAPLDDDTALIELTGREHSPLREIGPIRDLLMRIDVDRSHEAVPVMPLSTISVTEDLSTAMRIHSLGYSSVYHPKVLAHGLAPEDLRSAMQQRLRWAQGTIQVMLRENPLTYPGLAPVQRLMYFATMWSYLFGFFAVVYLAAPVLYLLFGWTPVEAYTGEFLRRLIPYLVANQILFLVVSWRLKTWRGQQYNLALFPVWIHAVFSTVRSVFGGRRLDFVVTPKGQRQGASVADITWQMVAIGALTVAVAVGFVKLAIGDIDDRVPITINILWALYDLLALSVVVWALARRPAAAATAAPIRGGAGEAPAPPSTRKPAGVPAQPTIDGTIEPWDGGVAVVRLHGRLDFAASSLARRRFHDLVRGGYRRLVIDLHGVDVIDSAGIVSLIEGLKAARQVGGDLRIAEAAAATRPALATADLDRVLRLYPTVEDAVAAYFR